MNYVTKPPEFVDLPPFLAKRYGKSIIEKLISWSKMEYYDMIMYLYASGETKKANVLQDKYSSIHFLSHCHTFKELVRRQGAK